MYTTQHNTVSSTVVMKCTVMHKEVNTEHCATCKISGWQSHKHYDIKQYAGLIDTPHTFAHENTHVNTVSTYSIITYIT